jgi:parvulin-like peptidyl-prolyl isomerase
MRTPRILLAALVSVGILVAAGCGSSSVVPPSSVAVVNGEQVTRAAVDTLLAQSKVSRSQQNPPQTFPAAGTSEYQDLQKQAATYLVKQAEYRQQAKDLGISVTSADVDKAITGIVKQYFSGDQKKFVAALKQQGVTLAQYTKDIEPNQLIVTKLTKEITKDVNVSDADVKAYYDKNKGTSAYTTPESRTMRHILVKSKAQADKLYSQLQGGADFAKLEQKYSLDKGTNQQGGTLTITKGSTVPEYEKTAFALKTGTISKPVHSPQYGYFIIKPVSDLKPAVTKPLSSVAKSIKTTLLQQKQNAAIAAWVKKTDDYYKGKVKYADGFAPPAVATSTSATTTTG